jgi:hypothetical protein
MSKPELTAGYAGSSGYHARDACGAQSNHHGPIYDICYYVAAGNKKGRLPRVSPVCGDHIDAD